MAPDIAEKSGSTKEQEITVVVTVRIRALPRMHLLACLASYTKNYVEMSMF
jgi:hypothetical protein